MEMASSLTDKELSEMKKHIKKLLTKKEQLMDTKRINSVILLMNKCKDIRTFWIIVKEQCSLTSNCFVMWKFCELLYKLISNGPKEVLENVPWQQDMIKECSNYWVRQPFRKRLQILQYCDLLSWKLHILNTYKDYFDCNFMLLKEEAKWDLDVCFQLCMDLMEVLERMLTLKSAVINDLQMQRIKYGSKAGECRLSPLTSILLECEIIYMRCLDFMRILHAQLPASDVVDMEKRFYDIFAEFHRLYDILRDINFIANLIKPLTLLLVLPNFYETNTKTIIPMPSAPPADS